MPTELGVWTVRRRLGRGGMGTVYHCQNSLLPGVQAAVKTMDPKLARSRRSRQRFVREAEVLFGLEHPHIVKVRNVHMDHDPPFLEMDFIAGQSLGGLLGAGTLTLGSAITLASQLCSAVAYLHREGVSHRDIKPDNIIVADEHATLVDFGLVSEDHSSTLSRPGALFGTLSYVPPEWGGVARPDGEAWDLYSLGVVLYELFTGRPAFPGSADLPFVEQLNQVQGAKSRGYLDPGEAHAPEVRLILSQLTAVSPVDRVCDLADAADRLQQLRRQLAPEEAARRVVEQVAQAKRSTETWSGASMAEGAASSPAQVGGAPTAVPEWTMWQTAHGATSPEAPSTAVPEDFPASQPTSPLPPEGESSEREGGGSSAGSRTTVAEADSAPASGGGRALLAAGLVAGLAGLGLLLWPSAPAPPSPAAPASWPLVLHLSPAVPELAVQAWLDDRPVALDAMPAVEGGAHVLRLRMGDDCGEGVLPEHCTEVTETIIVGQDGAGAERRLELPEVPRHTVELEPSSAVAIRARVEGEEWTESAPKAVLGGRRPGVVPVVVQAGDCPDVPCGEGCPPVCSEVQLAVTVPYAAPGPVSVPVDIAAPEAPPAPAPKARTPPLFSVGRFASWLGRNTGYQREAAISAGLANDRYLRGWSGSTPPDKLHGKSIGPSTPVEAVSPVIAAKACAGRGGLRSVEASPRSWDASGSGTPTLEIRRRGGESVLLQYDGEVLLVSSTTASASVGFRCAR